MRVCQIMAGNEDGGLEKHTIELSNQLKEAGIDTYVIAHPDFSKYFKNVNFIDCVTKMHDSIVPHTK